jgi:hypothetical protein
MVDLGSGLHGLLPLQTSGAPKSFQKLSIFLAALFRAVLGAASPRFGPKNCLPKQSGAEDSKSNLKLLELATSL